MSDLEDTIERVEAVKKLYPTHTNGAIAGMLVCGDAHTITHEDSDRGEYTLTYRVMEAVLNGELVPAPEVW